MRFRGDVVIKDVHDNRTESARRNRPAVRHSEILVGEQFVQLGNETEN
jgi:hypothetical protein